MKVELQAKRKKERKILNSTSIIGATFVLALIADDRKALSITLCVPRMTKTETKWINSSRSPYVNPHKENL